MLRRAPLVLAVGFLLTRAVPTIAQQPVAGIDTLNAIQQERLGPNHLRAHGTPTTPVELRSGDTQIFTDELEYYSDTSVAVATGHFVLTQTGSHIAADRAEFNLKTKLGTFYNATGFATIKPQPARPGVVAPPVSPQDTDVYFFGDKIEKIGVKKYRITNGGFTTCVQPTPRWELSSSTTILNIDHYTLLRDAVFSVKGVPMLYTPVLYYPTKREDRATGFLIPTYGSSTLRGQAIHNAFFWAINRSQDATIMHDWFSQTGQGIGSEYRYNYGGNAAGNLAAHLLDEHDSAIANPDGTVGSAPGSRSYQIRGDATQLLPYGLHARGRVDYFSSVTTNQTFNTNYYDAFRSTRSFGGNVVGAWGNYSLNTTLDHTENFASATYSGISGNWPRITFNRNERPIAGTPIYFSLGTEYASLLRENIDKAAGTDIDQGTGRVDVTPRIRFPFTRWQWFTINSSLGWRDTYYTRSVAEDGSGLAVDQSVNRRFFTAQAQLVGPVFTRVWDTPDNGYAEKFKHSVEPFLNIQRTSSIDNFNQIIQIDGTDTIVGGTTQYAYGVNNRFYAKRRIGQTSQPREIVDVQLTQTYYTDQRAAQYDPRYVTSLNGAPASKFSPILLSVRGMPTNDINATVTAEFDSRYHSLRQISAGGSYSWTGRVQTTVNWSKRAYIPQLAGFNDPTLLDQSLNATSNVHTRDNRFGGIYSFSYDVLRTTMLQQRVSGFYNAQCCGLAFEYQTFNFGGVSSVAGIPSDHRFFLSFTLAGLGNFSPFNGAMSGIPR